ncbi:MAG: LytR family transcriptional regulator [Actinobacteria bacterium ATB1]|nr:LytR family transcriptional regulator [Actinobacteria bacterium ATB1]
MKPKRFRRTRRTVLGVVGLFLFVMAGAAAYAAYGAWKLNRNIGRVTISRPADSEVVTSTTLYEGPDTPQTYLLLGSDTRSGESSAFLDPKKGRSGQGGGGADAIILVRVDPKTNKTQMVSIHRDLRVKIPGHGYGKINSTLVYGSQDAGVELDPSLTVQVVEELTGVHIDHVGIVDFAGFRDIVDAVGGVEICLEFAERDKWTGLDLPAGCTNANGLQALSYARSRHTYIEKDGRWVCDCTDDFGRMHRQQAFLRALASKLASPGQLANLSQLADAVKGRIWVDDQVDIRDTIALARRMAGYLDNVATAALPVYNKNISGVSYAILNEQAAAELMAAFNAGTMQTVDIVETPGGADPEIASDGDSGPDNDSGSSGSSGGSSSSRTRSRTTSPPPTSGGGGSGGDSGGGGSGGGDSGGGGTGGGTGE